MDTEWPPDCQPHFASKRCRCKASVGDAHPRPCRSRPSRHSARSWATGGVVGGVWAGVGSGPGVCPRPVTADPAARPHVRRPSTAPAPGPGRAPVSGQVRRRGSAQRHAAHAAPMLPESPEEQLDSWTYGSGRLPASVREAAEAAGASRSSGADGAARGRGRSVPADDEAEAYDSLREKMAADVMGPPPRGPPARPPTMDDGSVFTASAPSSANTSANTTRTSSVTATATATATTGLGTAAYSCSQRTSSTASLDRMDLDLQSQDGDGRAERGPADRDVAPGLDHLDHLDSVDPLAARMYQDDSQGSQVVLPVRVEAGTDPVAELDEDADCGRQGKPARVPQGGAEWTGRSRKRRSRDARKRLPTRYRVPLHEYHPTLQALPGRRTRSEGENTHRALSAAGGGAAVQGVGGGPDGAQCGGGGAGQPRVPAENRRRRLERLAQPNYRHDSRRNRLSAKPNLSVGPEPIWPIPKAALRAQPTAHLSRLSIAPSRKLDVHADASTSRSRTAHSSASVTSRVSARLEALSKPRLPFVRREGAGPRGCHRRMSDAEWKRHKEWLRVNAQPRRDHSQDQRTVRRGRSASLRRLLPRLRVLAKPSPRAVAQPSEPHLQTASAVSQGALRYQASERIIRLSQPLLRRLTNSAR